VLAWLALAGPRWRWPVAAVLILGGIALPALLGDPAGTASREARADTVWRPFIQEHLADLVANGRVVLVDVTADWCITCQANKAAVLDRGEVAARLASDVTGLKADWTRPDPAIQAYLASFNRYGIPFNAVYGPAAPGGIALPEILTDSAVLQAFAKAAAR
jgi:suppressor for copper-sensitivity B